jgi:hypothetical protein
VVRDFLGEGERGLWWERFEAEGLKRVKLKRRRFQAECGECVVRLPKSADAGEACWAACGEVY